MSRLDKPSRDPLLCYVTDRHSLAAFESRESQETLLSKIGAAAAAGVDWIQIREKDLLGKECGLLTRKALQQAAKLPAGNTAPTRILVNDRLEVALSEHAGGVHLSENSLPLREAMRLANAQAQDPAPSSPRRRKRRSVRRKDLSGLRKFAAPCPSRCWRSAELRWRTPPPVSPAVPPGSRQFAFSRTLRTWPPLSIPCES